MTTVVVQAYSWILPVAAPFAFIMAWGMGANELSSNWGNVFGSKVLKLWQIVCLAAVFEFIGAISLGSGVASTIRSSILSSSAYATMPEVLMFGFLCVIITCSIWIFIANSFGFPISDSQTTVLALIGVGLASIGPSAVRWTPGFSNIGIAWAVSPPSAAIVGFCFFYILRFFVLKRDNAVVRAKRLFPIFVFLILSVNFFFFMFETPLIEDQMTPGIKAAIAVSAAFILTVVAQFTYLRWISKKIEEAEALVAANEAEAQITEKEGSIEVVREEMMIEGAQAAVEGDAEMEKKAEIVKQGEIEVADIVNVKKLDRVESFLSQHKVTSFMVEDVHVKETTKDEKLANVYAAADRYPVGVELMFTHLLIITACFKSFAHGASDVSNAVGPLAAIVNILEDGVIDSRSTIPFWTLVLGAAGMSLGILTYGYKTLTMLAIKVTRISPVRGVCIDLAAAIVIITATYLKIPVSTTQITVCSIVGVGIATGIREKVHWANFLIIVIGWAVTLVFSAALSFCLTSFGLRSPSIVTF